MELKEIPGIGDKTADAFAKAGITNIPELVTNFPRTYRTYRALGSREAAIGDWVVLRGTISRPDSRHTGRVSTQSATFWDTSGSLTLRWFNMPYIVRSLSTDSNYEVKGMITEFAGRRQIVAPQLTKIDPETPHEQQIVPIYSSRAGVKPWIFRQKISQVLAHIDPIPDPLPSAVRNKYKLAPYHQAIQSIHFPDSEDALEQAIRRLSFQELFDLQLDSLRTKKSKIKPGIQLKVNSVAAGKFIDSLPFELTDSQISAISAITQGLQSDIAMNRLLQGEVGSGKTVVAVASAIAVHSAGYRTLVMAPTQILAVQLYDNFSRFCAPLGITVALVTGKSKGDAQSDIVVGTQALLNLEKLTDVGLIIVDEQHRFGVAQRDQLMSGPVVPHLLQMTATPIPRSLAQTIFHHVDITRLVGVPKNRLPVKTFLVPETKRLDSYTWMHREVVSHQNQIFIVVPLIEEAEENDVTPLKSLKELESKLKITFPDLEVDIMHGKMKETEKLEHMSRFKQGLTQILVATSMIEVGIDIPEANIIVIEDAERFGLAQLHQLRGRVGRGGKQGYCMLFSHSITPKAVARLSFFLRERDGEKLAKFDMELRGPGEIFGILQSGFFNLRLGNMFDERLLSETYEAAKSVIDKNQGVLYNIHL